MESHGTHLHARAVGVRQRRLGVSDQGAEPSACGDSDNTVAIGGDAFGDRRAEAAAEAHGIALGQFFHEWRFPSVWNHPVNDVELGVCGARDRVGTLEAFAGLRVIHLEANNVAGLVARRLHGASIEN